MRLVLYTLQGDRTKAERIAKMARADDGVEVQGGEAKGCAIELKFKKVGSTDGYLLSESTKMAIAASVGLMERIESVVFLMHAYPGKLCPQGAAVQGAGGRITSTASAWSLGEVNDLLRRWTPRSIYFLCCEFGQTRTGRTSAPYTVADGPLYVANGLPRGVQICSERERVMTSSGMPLLDYSFYNRRFRT